MNDIRLKGSKGLYYVFYVLESIYLIFKIVKYFYLY